MVADICIYIWLLRDLYVVIYTFTLHIIETIYPLIYQYLHMYFYIHTQINKFIKIEST